MAIDYTLRSSGYDTSNGSSYSTTAFLPTTNTLYICFVGTTDTTTPEVPTIDGSSPGLTWTQINTIVQGLIRTTAFYGFVTGTPGNFGNSINYGTNQTGTSYIIVSADNGVDLLSSGAGSIVQSTTNSTTSGSSTTFSITSTGVNKNNSLIACAGTNFNSVITGDGNYVEVTQGGYATPTHRLQVQYQSYGTDNVSNWSGPDALTVWRGIAVEILANTHVNPTIVGQAINRASMF